MIKIEQNSRANVLHILDENGKILAFCGKQREMKKIFSTNSKSSDEGFVVLHRKPFDNETHEDIKRKTNEILDEFFICRDAFSYLTWEKVMKNVV